MEKVKIISCILSDHIEIKLESIETVQVYGGLNKEHLAIKLLDK